MVILTAVILSFLLTIFFGLYNNYAKRDPQKYIQRCILVGTVFVPVVRMAEGTFYSHGFDIHWFVFGVFNLFVIFVTAATLIGLLKLYGYWKKA